MEFFFDDLGSCLGISTIVLLMSSQEKEKVMLLTKEQQLEKLKCESALKKDYEQIIKKFFRKQVLDLPEETMVLTTAYGINREALFYGCVSEHLDNRVQSIINIPDPNQQKLF